MSHQTIHKECLRLSAGTALLSAVLLGVASPCWAAPTRVTLETRGILRVDHQGRLTADLGQRLTADLGEGLPSSGFFDVYTGTYVVSSSNFPTGAVSTSYASTLTGTVDVDETSYPFDETPLPTVSAATANALAADARALSGSSSGAFFPGFLPNTYYRTDGQGDIVIASQTDLDTVFPDVGPLAVFYDEGTFMINIPSLTLVATPVVTAAPEPATLALFAVGLLGLGATTYRNKHR